MEHCFRSKEEYCPRCGYKIDAHSSLFGGDGRPPEHGDFSICLNCQSVLMYLAKNPFSTEVEIGFVPEGVHVPFKIRIAADKMRRYLEERGFQKRPKMPRA